jgi:hypothetical protein
MLKSRRMRAYSTFGRDGSWIQNFREETTRRTFVHMEDNMRMDLREIGWEVVDSIHLA